MPTMMQVPADHPVMVAWREYQATDEYVNSRKWASDPEHIDGSLWAAFLMGYRTAMGGNVEI